MGGIVKSATKVVQSLLGIEAPNIPSPPPAVVQAAETPPVVAPVKEMPIAATSSETKTATRRAVAEQKKRRGRASTILTTDLTDSDTLG
jgi:hypothetical protein